MRVQGEGKRMHSTGVFFFPVTPSGSRNWGSLKGNGPLWQLKMLLGGWEETGLLLAED